MAQNVMITGAGTAPGLGYNFVKRYLENGDRVIATIRRPSEDLDKLLEQYGDQLSVVTMDIADTASVEKAEAEIAKLVDCIDVLINNAVMTTKYYPATIEEADLDQIAEVFNVTAVGALRVTKAFFPLLYASKMPAIVANITSEAGSMGACFRSDTMYEYCMSKAALNMGTLLLHNKYKEDHRMNVICIQPGWMRTHLPSPAPCDPYDNAEMMRLLIEKKRTDYDGPVFVTYEGEEYPW